MVNWNIWKGCCEFNEFCANCKVIKKGLTKFDVQIDDFDLPIHTKSIEELELKYPSYTIFNVCPLSDFFLENTDASREKYWNIMRLRHDCLFVICTKRVERLAEHMPKEPLNNVAIVLSVSTQKELGMFSDMDLTGVNFDYFVTTDVVTMAHMFEESTGINSDMLKNFSTGNVRTMSSMFSESDVEILDLSHFETNSLEYVAEMFAYCEMLEEVTLDGWDFSQVVDFTGMFLECNDISCIYC